MKALISLLLPFLLCACMSTRHVQPVDDRAIKQVISAAPTEFEMARQSILAMAGEYQVTFSFAETEALQPGYQLKKHRESDAYEMVLLVEDSDTRIVLQHILVHRGSGFVIKHWRQDWHYEAKERLEFSEDQTWRLKAIDPALTKGAWTQCVYEVSDAPRYCGTGKWVLQDHEPVWTSDAGWRPLPRREYTKRDDYNALGIINRQSIVSSGWVHEQQNTKAVREGEVVKTTIAKEEGLNTYRRISGYNFQPGYTYWENTKDYWQRIRNEWDRRIAAGNGIHLKYPIDGMKMIMDMYWQSERARKGKPVSDQDIHDLFEPWVIAP